MAASDSPLEVVVGSTQHVMNNGTAHDLDFWYEVVNPPENLLPAIQKIKTGHPEGITGLARKLAQLQEIAPGNYLHLYNGQYPEAPEEPGSVDSSRESRKWAGEHALFGPAYTAQYAPLGPADWNSLNEGVRYFYRELQKLKAEADKPGTIVRA